MGRVPLMLGVRVRVGRSGDTRIPSYKCFPLRPEAPGPGAVEVRSWWFLVERA